MSSFKDPEFRRLQAIYYKKLRDDGFQDIENAKGQIIDHQTPASFSQRAEFRTGYVEVTREYYTWASSMLSHGQFASRLDQHIWELHTEGKSSREIQLQVQLEQTWVSRKIKKIKEYLLRQQAYNPKDFEDD